MSRQCSASTGRPASSSTPARMAAYSGSSLDAARGRRRSIAAPGLPGPRRPRRGGPAPAHRPALGAQPRRTRHGPRRGPAGRATSARAGSPARRPGRERHRGTGIGPGRTGRSASPTCPRPASSTASAPRVVNRAGAPLRSAAARRPPRHARPPGGCPPAPRRVWPDPRRTLRRRRGRRVPREPVEGASRSRPGQQGRAVVGHVADELLGQLGGTFVVGHPTQHVPAQQKQVDQEGPFGDRRASVA